MGSDFREEDAIASTSWATDSARPDPSALAAATATATFSRRKNRNANIRKRAVDDGEDDNVAETVAAGLQGGADEEDGEGPGASVVIRKAKQARGGDLAFSTRIERTADEIAAVVGVMYEGSMKIGSGRDSLATGMLETETQLDRDARRVPSSKIFS
jgi:hypothetical protein